jgi:signal transduction histidine kinase
MLRPLRTITAGARRMTGERLHERFALTGAQDEIKDLGDTFDAMLARLEVTFQDQQLFAANAAHELRTPLGVMHAEVQSDVQPVVVRGDPALLVQPVENLIENAIKYNVPDGWIEVRVRSSLRTTASSR